MVVIDRGLIAPCLALDTFFCETCPPSPEVGSKSFSDKIQQERVHRSLNTDLTVL